MSLRRKCQVRQVDYGVRPYACTPHAWASGRRAPFARVPSRGAASSEYKAARVMAERERWPREQLGRL